MAKLYCLSRDVELRFRDLHTVRAKAGDPVKMIPDGRGIPCFALVTGRVAPEVAAIYSHDSKYYHVWVSADHVEEVKPGLRWGTSYFIGRVAAERYYSAYEADPARAVARKLADGEIHIGKPLLKPGQRLSIIPGEGRYQIEESGE